jgi:predicted RNA-binding protein with PUA-like domain
MSLPAGAATVSAAGILPTVNGTAFLWISRVVVRLLASLVYPLARLTRAPQSAPRMVRRLLVAAGVRGWELIEYQEIASSASEYLGVSNVSRLSFSGIRPMLAEFHEAIQSFRPSHYYFDPRSGSQRFLKAVWEAVVIGIVLERNRVIPICVVADFPEKRWRLQAAIVSAGQGVVVSYMAADIVRSLFPHPRLIGPMPFPLSVKTLRQLNRNRSVGNPKWRHLRKKVVFVGMLYEPRKAVIEGIQRELAKRRIPMEIIGRMPDGSRIPDNEYWSILSNARLVVSTSSHVAGSGSEFASHHHFVYKFIEVTAAKTALAIEPVAFSFHLLTPDVDYLAYSSVEEAVEKITLIWSRHKALAKIARNGALRTASLIENHYYWSEVFRALDKGL